MNELDKRLSTGTGSLSESSCGADKIAGNNDEATTKGVDGALSMKRRWWTTFSIPPLFYYFFGFLFDFY